MIRIAIKAVGLIDHKWYMRLYVPYLRRLGVNIVGTPMYISPKATIDGSNFNLITIGDRAVISSGVRILTHDFSVDRALESFTDASLPDDGLEYQLVGPVTIGARAFIGAGSILLLGCDVGEGSIVGAGSVVRGRIAPGKIVVGNPAVEVEDVETWLQRARRRAEPINAALAPINKKP